MSLPPAAVAPAATPPRRRRRRAQWDSLRTGLTATARLLGPSAQFLTTPEAHTYAYSVAANCLLASLPFLFLLIWVANHLFPRLPNEDVIARLLNSYLPTGQDVLMAHALRMAHRHVIQVFSLVMLAISSSGVFLPLEVALNSIWGFTKNRSYLANQLVSLGLVVGCGLVAYLSIFLSAVARAGVEAVFPATWTGTIEAFTSLFLTAFAVPAAMLAFFLIYWWLPHGKVPPLQVVPAAFYTGLLAEVFIHAFRWLLPALDFSGVYGELTIAVTLVVWGYCGALLLLFGASLSARGVARLPTLHGRAWYAPHGAPPPPG